MAEYTLRLGDVYVLVDAFTPSERWMLESDARAHGLLTDEHVPSLTLTAIDYERKTITIEPTPPRDS